MSANILDYGTETIYHFIKTKIKNAIHVKTDILDKIKYVTDDNEDYSSQGFYYERLWDLCIKFGVTSFTTPDTYHIMNENPNNIKLSYKHQVWDLKSYLNQPIRSGNTTGFSDITFINKDPETLFFISVKYFKEEKDISKYDIGKLCTLIRKHERLNRTTKLFIFVKNKEKAITKFKAQNASSHILLKYINPSGNYEHVYDVNDLQDAFFKLKKLLEHYNYLENINDFTIDKPIFIPRFHQKLFILKINDLIKEDEKNILVGAIPRSGKSYIMAGTILEYIKQHPEKYHTFLLMTPSPNETFEEYTNIFNTYIDFQNANIDVTVYKNKIKKQNKNSHSVIIISKQKLGWSKKTDDIDKEEDITFIESNIIKIFGSIPIIDIIFLDEAHFGMSTEKSQEIVALFNSASPDAVKVYVTATYNKPFHVYGVSEKSKLTWDMQDIQIMKNFSLSSNPYKERFGNEIYKTVLEYYNNDINRIKKEYSIFPVPYMITTLWDKEFLNIEKQKIGTTDFGWDMNKLFSNEEQLKEMLRYYFGYPNKEDNYEKQSFYRVRGIMPRIKNICSKEQCRTLQSSHKTTQLWFLPIGTGKIKDKVQTLIDILTTSKEFKDINKQYHFFVAIETENVSTQNITYLKNPQNIKSEIEELQNETDLIILSGQRLQLGISLKNVDIVTLWNSTSSADALFQMLFRSMTEDNNKKYGFMVDMNPQRSLINVSLFSENALGNNTVYYRQITDLINIDEDVFHDRFENDKESFVNELFRKLYESWDIQSSNMKHFIKNISFDLAKLEFLRDAFSKIKIDKKNKKTNIISEPEDTITKGTTRKSIGKLSKKETTMSLYETATELISEFLSLLNIFTLYDDNGSNCILDTDKNVSIDIIDDVKVLKENVYRNNDVKQEFLQILNGRLGGDINVPFPEDIIENVFLAVAKTGDKHLINKLIMTQKKKYYTINESDHLLSFMNEQLKPKSKEKKENGEVFTPLSLVNEMMDKLDDCYYKQYKRSIFAEKDFKWLDNAVGIGNFPVVVYQKLMDGLKIEIPNEEKRRKHIVENMLYACELTPKNVLMYKKIFCSKTYKLNIRQGDSLEMDFDTSFDVIIGNPPFQKQVGPAKTEPIWGLFVQKSLSLLRPEGFLVYVHPSGWRNADGRFKAVQKDIFDKNLLYLEIHDEKDGRKVFESATRYDWYVLQNSPYKKKTNVLFQDGKKKIINVTDLDFIPNGLYDKIKSLVAKKSEEKVEVIYSSSLYETRKDIMSRKKTSKHKYPCIYTISSNNEKTTYFYSTVKEEHFGIPKLIWTDGSIETTGSYIDENGDYCLTQFAYAIVDKPNILKNIKKAFDSIEFREIMSMCAVGRRNINYKIIALFRKDFWKDFLN
jgi:hypothetical protein